MSTTDRRALSRVSAPRGGPRDPVRAGRAARRATARRRARLVGLIGGAIVAVGFLFAFYFPTRSWMHQRQQAKASAQQLAKIDAANKQLEAQARSLQQPATIEQLARGTYGLVMPGEHAYVVLPPPAGPTTLPQIWPFATTNAAPAPTTSSP